MLKKINPKILGIGISELTTFVFFHGNGCTIHVTENIADGINLEEKIWNYFLLPLRPSQTSRSIESCWSNWCRCMTNLRIYTLFPDSDIFAQETCSCRQYVRGGLWNTNTGPKVISSQRIFETPIASPSWRNTSICSDLVQSPGPFTIWSSSFFYSRWLVSPRNFNPNEKTVTSKY